MAWLVQQLQEIPDAEAPVVPLLLLSDLHDELLPSSASHGASLGQHEARAYVAQVAQEHVFAHGGLNVLAGAMEAGAAEAALAAAQEALEAAEGLVRDAEARQSRLQADALAQLGGLLPEVDGLPADWELPPPAALGGLLLEEEQRQQAAGSP